MDKVKPHSEELEQVVLGALLIDTTAIMDIADKIKPEHFYITKHQEICTAILDLFNDGDKIDTLTVAHRLRKNGTYETVGEHRYVMLLTTLVYTKHNLLAHYLRVIEYFKRRQLVDLFLENINKANDLTEDILDLEEDIFEQFIEQTASVAKGDFTKIDKATSMYLDELDDRIKSNEIEYPTGFSDYDEKTGGLQIGLQVLGARPAMGKTAYAIQLLINLALQNMAVVVFSLEMPKSQLIGRVVSNICSINSEKLRDGDISEAELSAIVEKTAEIVSKNVFIFDGPEALTTGSFRSKMQKIKMQFPDQKVLAIVDYLQLMVGTKGNREQEINQIAQTLRLTGNGLGIPVLALSQLGRSVEQRPDRKPILADLRESGAIEQEAHTVFFLYRPEYYKIPEDEEGNPTAGKGYLLIAKNRNGNTGDVEMKFKGQYSRFTGKFEIEHPANDYQDNSSIQNAENDFEPKTETEKDGIPF